MGYNVCARCTKAVSRLVTCRRLADQSSFLCITSLHWFVRLVSQPYCFFLHVNEEAWKRQLPTSGWVVWMSKPFVRVWNYIYVWLDEWWRLLWTCSSPWVCVNASVYQVRDRHQFVLLWVLYCDHCNFKLIQRFWHWLVIGCKPRIIGKVFVTCVIVPVRV